MLTQKSVLSLQDVALKLAYIQGLLDEESFEMEDRELVQDKLEDLTDEVAYMHNHWELISLEGKKEETTDEQPPRRKKRIGR